MDKIKWIPASKPPPMSAKEDYEISDQVLCYGYNDTFNCFQFEVGRHDKHRWLTSHIIPFHWIPLPAPPGEDKKTGIPIDV